MAQLIEELERVLKEMSVDGVATISFDFSDVSIVLAALKAQNAYSKALDEYIEIGFDKAEKESK